MRSRIGLAGVAAVVAGIWVLAFSVAAATASTYPAAYWPAYYFAAAGLALVATGGVLASAFL